jgi:hypothetical protein
VLPSGIGAEGYDGPIRALSVDRVCSLTAARSNPVEFPGGAS